MAASASADETVDHLAVAHIEMGGMDLAAEGLQHLADAHDFRMLGIGGGIVPAPARFADERPDRDMGARLSERPADLESLPRQSPGNDGTAPGERLHLALMRTTSAA